MPTPRGFDVVVVGGGAAGCVVARRLAESGGRSVLLLEAGPDRRSDTPEEWWNGWQLPVVPDWGFTSEPIDVGASSRLRRGRVLGGTSWLTRFAVRGAAADFDAWAASGNPGWSFADVLPFFRRLEADAEFGNRPWHGDHGPIPITRYPNHRPSDIHAAVLDAFDATGFSRVEDHNEPGSVGFGPMPMNAHEGRRVTSADAYLPATARIPELVIRANSPVDAVVLKAGAATGVRLVDGTQIAASSVVLAAGTYGSPMILMRSGIGPADHLGSLGIAVQADLSGVGANLADHPGVDLDSGWRGMATIGPVLHSMATFAGANSSPDGSPDLMFWVADPDGDEPGLYLDPILLKPRSRGTVRLRSSDPMASPRITLPGLRETVDVDRLVEGYRRGLELANRPEIRRLSTEAAPSDPGSIAEYRRRVVENAYSLPHVVGTCAVGPSPADGAVVDATGRVHGIQRLSVVDASIIPAAPSGFPHLITVMLAELLAERMGAVI